MPPAAGAADDERVHNIRKLPHFPGFLVARSLRRRTENHFVFCPTPAIFAPQYSGQPRPSIQNLPIAAIDAQDQLGDDNRIIEIVLSDLTRLKGVPLSLDRESPRDVYFYPAAMEVRPTPLEAINHNDGWQELKHLDRSSIEEAVRIVVGRYTRDETVGQFTSDHRMIHVIEERASAVDAEADVPYGEFFPVQAWAPGYSSEGDCAVVCLYFPELYHPSVGTYVLTRLDSGWIIEFRGFITYL